MIIRGLRDALLDQVGLDAQQVLGHAGHGRLGIAAAGRARGWCLPRGRSTMGRSEPAKEHMKPHDESASIEHRLVRVRGIVQGVGFRDSCMRHARAHGIAGWVRNRRDGSVEALLQGSPQQLAQMCDWLRHGVPGARVDALEQSEVQPPPALSNGFDILPTV
jgi:acylphosphatase